MTSASRWIAILAGLCLFPTLAAAETPEALDFFEKKIRPVLVSKCYQCHSADSKEVKGGLLLDSRDGIRKGGDSGHAVVPGDLNDSLIIESLRWEGLKMPPDEQLPAAVVADFVKWIEMGAPDPREGKVLKVQRTIDIEKGREYWAFRPVAKVEPPQVKSADWPQSDIDRFILARLENTGLQPVADADRVTWIRRATFALTGLPPTVEEIDAFLADSGADAFEKVVDRLLDSPRFGERWGRHWLDVARYAESTGLERNVTYPYAWRYRNYVIDAFNADKPYDKFIVEQLAGDLLPAADDANFNEQVIATGFLAIGTKGLNNRNNDEYIMEVVDDQIDVTTRAFLGITVSCARCHDHKFDPFPTTDYYAMAGIFRSSSPIDGVQRGRNNDYAGNHLPLGMSGKELDAQHRQHLASIKKLETQIAELKGEETAEAVPANKKVAQNRKKQQQANGRKVVAKKVSADDAAKLEEFQQTLKSLRESIPPQPEVCMAMTEGRSIEDCKVHLRGEVDNLGPAVPRGFVTVASTDKASIPANHSGRLELAAWIARPENPLTARVAANRIWHHLFGQGIVRTIDNFGELGEQPSHPELLDYLAGRFVANGWSHKQLIREIMLSRSYRLGSSHDATAFEIDPENHLVWRMSRRRLDAESIRDSLLMASGSLSLERPDSSPVQKLGTGEIGRTLRVSESALESPCRSVYLPILRGVVPEMLRVFDLANPSLIVGQRDVTTVATQALYMMNSPLVMDQSQKFATRILAEPADNDSQRIELAYRMTLGRQPTPEEVQRAEAFLARYLETLDGKSKSNQASAWAGLAQVLFSTAEFRYVY